MKVNDLCCVNVGKHLNDPFISDLRVWLFFGFVFMLVCMCFCCIVSSLNVFFLFSLKDNSNLEAVVIKLTVGLSPQLMSAAKNIIVACRKQMRIAPKLLVGARVR